MIRVGFIKEVIFKQRLEGEGVSHEFIYRKEVPARGHSFAKTLSWEHASRLEKQGGQHS